MAGRSSAKAFAGVMEPEPKKSRRVRLVPFLLLLSSLWLLSYKLESFCDVVKMAPSSLRGLALAALFSGLTAAEWPDCAKEPVSVPRGNLPRA